MAEPLEVRRALLNARFEAYRVDEALVAAAGETPLALRASAVPGSGEAPLAEMRARMRANHLPGAGLAAGCDAAWCAASGRRLWAFCRPDEAFRGGAVSSAVARGGGAAAAALPGGRLVLLALGEGAAACLYDGAPLGETAAAVPGALPFEVRDVVVREGGAAAAVLLYRREPAGGGLERHALLRVLLAAAPGGGGGGGGLAPVGESLELVSPPCARDDPEPEVAALLDAAGEDVLVVAGTAMAPRGAAPAAAATPAPGAAAGDDDNDVDEDLLRQVRERLGVAAAPPAAADADAADDDDDGAPSGTASLAMPFSEDSYDQAGDVEDARRGSVVTLRTARGGVSTAALDASAAVLASSPAASLAPGAPVLLGVRRGVDMLVVSAGASAAAGRLELRHTGTFPGLAYVQESKRHKKFFALVPRGPGAPGEAAAAVIAEYSRYAYVYAAPPAGALSAPQHVLDTGAPLLGLAVSGRTLRLLVPGGALSYTLALG